MTEQKTPASLLADAARFVLERTPIPRSGDAALRAALMNYDAAQPAFSVQVSAWRYEDGNPANGIVACNDDLASARGIGVYIRAPMAAFHVRDFDRDAEPVSATVGDAYTYAEALAEHLGCPVDADAPRRSQFKTAAPALLALGFIGEMGGGDIGLTYYGPRGQVTATANNGGDPCSADWLLCFYEDGEQAVGLEGAFCLSSNDRRGMTLAVAARIAVGAAGDRDTVGRFRVMVPTHIPDDLTGVPLHRRYSTWGDALDAAAMVRAGGSRWARAEICNGEGA